MIAKARVLIPQPNVWVNGIPLDKTEVSLYQATVVTEVDALSMFTLRINNQKLMPGQTRWVDSSLFDIGRSVEVKMNNSNSDRLIYGEITALEPEFTRDAVPIVIVRGYDLRHRLMKGQKTRTFTNTTDGAIADYIAKEANLKIDIAKEAKLGINDDKTEIKLEYAMQNNQSDWEFLKERADRIGYEITVDGPDLKFRPRQDNPSPILTLAYPDDIITFSPRLSNANQVDGVEVRGWDVQQKKVIVGCSKSSAQSTGIGVSLGSQKAVQVWVDQSVYSVEEAERIAESKFQELMLKYITGDGQCSGQPKLLADRVIKFEGVGERFGGKYYVTSATHIFGPEQGYRTDFSVQKIPTT